jgi:hypothetical protein
MCYEGLVGSVIRFARSLLSNIQITLVWIRNFADNRKTKTAAAAATTTTKTSTTKTTVVSQQHPL